MKSDTPVLAEGLRLIDSLPRGPFIGGAFREPGDRQTTIVINPASEEKLAEVAYASASDLDDAVSAARDALSSWRRTTPGARAAVLNILANRIEAQAEALAQVEALNGGKPIQVARAEVPAGIDTLRFMAGASRALYAPASGQYVPDHFSVIRREPVGVVGAITPWNYPLTMALMKIGPALAAGNTVVLKPAELTPLTTIALAQIAADVLPPGVLNVLVGGGSLGGAMSKHQGINLMTITGSVASGRAVAADAAATLKRLHLELGGKAPVVIFADADLDAVAENIKATGFWNSGQECGAATRLLVHSSVHDALVAKLIAAVETIVVGDPTEGDDVELGSMISERQLNSVDANVRTAVAEGATIAAGGHRLARRGFFYAPTVITGVRRGSTVAREEIFGPVVTVESFDTEPEAIERANDVDYGLAASVWTHDVATSLRVSDALDFGTVWVNTHLAASAELPWGGFGQSGYGQENSAYALDNYTRVKHLMIATASDA
jgi:1-pyrroline dehydrogenase